MEYFESMFEILSAIVSNQQLTEDTWLIALRSGEIAQAAKPGQFVMIRVRSGLDPFLRRPFSICGVRDDLFQVLYRVVGRGTRLMTELREGDRMWVLGPLGKGFVVTDMQTNRLLVGGGIGVAPLVFLDQFLGENRPTFMMGFRSAKEILPTMGIPAREGGTLIATDDGTQGHHGPVTDLLAEHLRNTRGQAFVYACGPKPMLRKVAEMTMALRTRCQVSLESNMACGLGACQGCAVKASASSGRSYWHVCKEGPVFNAEDIDWEIP